MRTFTAPTLNRIALELIRSKSTSRSRVARRSLVSYQLVASAVPLGRSGGGGTRGVKKPETPCTMAWPAAIWLITLRAALSWKSLAHPSVHPPPPPLTCSQNWRSLGTRSAGALPAMIALLMAPMEMPAIQVGSMSHSISAS